jgi:hypothetical protein
VAASPPRFCRSAEPTSHSSTRNSSVNVASDTSSFPPVLLEEPLGPVVRPVVVFQERQPEVEVSVHAHQLAPVPPRWLRLRGASVMRRSRPPGVSPAGRPRSNQLALFRRVISW